MCKSRAVCMIIYISILFFFHHRIQYDVHLPFRQWPDPDVLSFIEWWPSDCTLELTKSDETKSKDTHKHTQLQNIQCNKYLASAYQELEMIRTVHIWSKERDRRTGMQNQEHLSPQWDEQNRSRLSLHTGNVYAELNCGLVLEGSSRGWNHIELS